MIRKALYAFIWMLLSTVLFCETTSAQIFRRPLQRLPGFIPQQQPYRTGNQEPTQQPLRRQGPLVQGDGRFLERAMNVVSLFTESGVELKPVAVVSMASFDEYKRVIQIVAQEIRLARGSTEDPLVLNAFLDIYQRIIGLGFDTSQPLGMILQTDGVLFYPLIFTPLDGDSQFGQRFKSHYAENLPDGRIALRQDALKWPLGRLFVKQHQGWLFIATEPQLNALPDDPTVLLQGLDKQHLFAARFDLQNMPSLSTRAALSLGEASAVSQAETELEKANARLLIGYLRSLAEQSDFLEYTLSYDEANNDYVLRQTETVKPNTERARLLQARRNATSSLHAFYRPENAILASHFAMNLTQSQRVNLETILDETIGKHLLTEAEREEFKQQAIAETPQAKRRVRRTEKNQTGAAPTLAPAESPVETDKTDHRDRLAELLAKPTPTAPPEVPPTASSEAPQASGELPDLVLSDMPSGELTDTQKLETIFRRIGACYYWGLIGAVRSGQFDGASTCSLEQGFIGAYNIVEGDRFQKAFDAIFDELRTEFPDLYEQVVRKDYGESSGFRLTNLTFRPGGLLQKLPGGSWLPDDFARREMTVVLGVRRDAICYAVGRPDQAEARLLEAIAGTEKSLSVYDMFFVFSGYELAQALAQVNDNNAAGPLKVAAFRANPNARAFAVSEFTDTSKTITLRVSGLLTPSFWRFRDNFRP